MKEPKHYIVVDDDKTNNLICEFTIKSFNSQAVINLFLEPEEALMFIKEDYSKEAVDFPTILFLDVNMPVMSGWEFLDIFQEFKEHIKNQFQIFILTSSIEDFSNEAKLYPFVSGFLSKPLKKDKLKELVEGLTEVNKTKSRSY
ncbi:response regulator [Salinimicrobium sediminilitoris]|uniref:response regulator n=1 Tax=Salinimicrobium sediminilitoris TaxID=2876715 RepID=UPI001E4F48AF|nr:response regulator [Salinimicrobium sediminilitoris]MCC8361264.1 response regulator [Salinimicrobium sediminilitoris]